MQLIHQTWTDVAEYLETCRTIIVPLGAVEQHGPALPLGTDVIIAEALAREVGRRTGRLTAPALSPGISLVPHMNFPGTVSFMPDTFTHMIRDAVETLHHHGFRVFLFVNGHGGNDGAIKNALIELRYRLNDIRCDTANWWRMEAVTSKALAELGRPVGHGCAMEASLIWHINEEWLKKERFGREFKRRSFMVSNNLASEFVTALGLMNADQTQASGELGREVFELAVAEYTAMLARMEKA